MWLPESAENCGWLKILIWLKLLDYKIDATFHRCNCKTIVGFATTILLKTMSLLFTFYQNKFKMS